jgi:hypothetical protein
MKIQVTTHLCSSSFRSIFSNKHYDITDSSQVTVKIEDSDNWIAKVLANKKDYCEKNGYVFSARDFDPMPTERVITWHRIKNILEIMSSDDAPDWIMHTDLDSMFMDDSKKLEDFINRAERFGKKAILAHQGTGLVSDLETCELAHIKSQICAGHFFIKNCTWSRNLLQKMWDFPHENPSHLKLLYVKYHEQDILNTFFLNNFLEMKNNSLVCDNYEFNSFFPGWDDYTWYKKGDFIIHFAGLNWQQRNALVDEYIHRKSNSDESTWTDIPYKELIGGISYEDWLDEADKRLKKQERLLLIDEVMAKEKPKKSSNKRRRTAPKRRPKGRKK